MGEKITITKFPLDFWSFIHFGMWAFISSTVAAMKEPPLWVHLAYTFALGLAWEAFEGWASRKWPSKWGNRIESWLNSWIGDMLSDLAGSTFGWFVVAYYRKRYWILRK